MSTASTPALIASGAELERLADGAVWSEGPVWLPETRRLRWSDIPNDRILEWDARTGEVSTFRQPAEYTNGRALDHEGRVVQCSHGRRAIEREGAEGPEMIVDRWSGGRFNSPNDLAVASDGAIWFTDPPYGIDPSGREGHPGTSEYDACYVFRWDPVTGEAVPVVTSMVHPNGIAFSPGGTRLYVADTGFYADRPEAQQILVFEVDGATVVGPGTEFAKPPVGASDGFAVDREGRLWSSAGDGIYVYAPDGELLQHIPVPETVSNCTFGGDDGHDLFITASTSLYRIRTTTTAA
ncbi:SMP-30/gluconolactonase/LRE family protein [Microbacterium luteolum]|uniref:SMP-30/gluconolactonase/LRE family protein n=1 Tax=Microbacterium luteolum TaxID=69367 RepID=A0ABY7XW45_MICLT|nr:SMP-30/gluconolactonase/LRE family protein [Microbacterium luteolum]WDM44513.1 SMP-30/gluconolactonase/LRE family protein [Microbacterium luteolum]